MADRFGLDIQQLILEVENYDENSKERLAAFPVVSLHLHYAVREFPEVLVTISSAPPKAGTISRNYSFDSLKGLTLGTLAHVTLTVAPFKKNGDTAGRGENGDSIRLFSGYIAVSQSSFIANRVSVGATRTIRLICAAESLNNTPPGILTYYGTVAQSGRELGLDFQLIAQTANIEGSPELNPTEFSNNPAEYLVNWIAAYYQIVNACVLRQQEADQEGIVQAAVKPANFIPEKFAINDSVVEEIKKFIIPHLTAEGLSDTLHGLLNTFMLDWLPETVSDANNPCRMIIRPINAWSSEPTFTLDANDLLTVYGNTAYRLNSGIDCWCVGLPVGGVYGGTIAVYGPGLGGNSGKGRILSITDIYNALGDIKTPKQSLNKPIKQQPYVTARTLALPGWMVVAARDYVQVPAEGTGGATLVPIKSDNADERLKEWGLNFAVQAFLNEGREAIRMGVIVPLWIWLQLLPHLGNVGNIFVPEANESGNDLQKQLVSKEYFGMLAALDLQINVTNKEFECVCSAEIGSVRDAALQSEYSTPDVFYTRLSDNDGFLSDGQEAARLIAEDIGSLSGNRAISANSQAVVRDLTGEANEDI